MLGCKNYNPRAAHRSVEKEIALANAAERHLLEVNYYSRNGNAVRMWGRKNVDESLAEYKRYRANRAA